VRVLAQHKFGGRKTSLQTQIRRKAAEVAVNDLAYNQPLCTAVHRALASALRARMRPLARARGHPDAQTAARA